MHELQVLARRLFLQAPFAYIAWPVVAMLVGTLVRALAGKRIEALAIVPRTARGLLGLLTAPFVHANLSHLLANLPPFIVLGILVLRRGGHAFLVTAVTVALLSGALLWLLGRKAAHVGMSGVIFGFFGYLIGIAYVTRGAWDLLIAVAVLLVYGGMLAGLKPARNGTSWEGHLFGLIAGLGKVWIERQYL
jgi:membrane associated rhomboid family serine protease